MTASVTILQPDDFHLHLRDGEGMKSVLQDSAAQFGRAIIMPNLVPPITTVEQALKYRERILSALPVGSSFEPMMTLYLTDITTPEEIDLLTASPYLHAVKLYPAGATTNSAAGVKALHTRTSVLERMQKLGIPLLVHGEVTASNVDIFDREKVFIDEVLHPLLQQFPELRVVMEHITTEDAADYIRTSRDGVAATITAHHLLISRNDLLVGGIKPHHYCLPIVKREQHREALLRAATSGSSKYFLGTDSAPHPVTAKESACGCAGIYTAKNAIQLYAEAFDSIGKLDQLEAFASKNGADFYQLPYNQKVVTLIKQPSPVPNSIPFGADTLRPFRAGESIAWTLSSNI